MGQQEVLTVHAFSVLSCNRVNVLEHKYGLSPSHSLFLPSPYSSCRNALSWAQNIFIPKSINSVVLIKDH